MKLIRVKKESIVNGRLRDVGEFVTVPDDYDGDVGTTVRENIGIKRKSRVEEIKRENKGGKKNATKAR